MPTLIKTYVWPSPIDGLGLYADQDVPKGTVVWSHDDNLDGFIDPMDVVLLGKEAEVFNKHLQHFYCFDAQEHLYIGCSDLMNWANHSITPNLITPNKYTHIAAKLIKKGDELTINYRHACDDERNA